MDTKIVELIVRAQNKDTQAFEELYAMYYSRAYAIAFKIAKDHADAQDVVQETFIQIHKSIATLREPEYFYSWMSKIIISKCHRMFYKQRHQKSVEPTIMEQSKDYIENRRYMLPVDESEYVGEQSILYEIIKSMDDKYKEVLEMMYFDQLKMEEIARQLHIPIGTVKTRVKRAKEILKTKITNFENIEGRKLSFKVDSLLPTSGLLASGYLSKSMHFIKTGCSHVGTGSVLNVVGIIAISTLAITGSAIALDTYHKANIPTPLPQSIQESHKPTTSFGSFAYANTTISNSKEAYYLCINWAYDEEQMKKKTMGQYERILPIYEALKQKKDTYWDMLVKSEWVARFQLLQERYSTIPA